MGPLSVADFYQQNVIGGAGSFMIAAKAIATFGDALKRKLLLELIASGDGVAPALHDAQSASLAAEPIPITR